jgi:hypothetical protein
LAFDYGQPSSLNRLLCEPIYHQSPLENLRAVSPCLVELPKSPVERDDRLKHLLVHCRARPMLSFIKTTNSLTALRTAWQSCIYPICEDEQRFLLRFADTRIAVTLPHALSSSNWHLLAQPVSEWWIINRFGMPEKLSMPAPETAAEAVPVDLQLNMAELDALMQRGQPDAVINFLAESFPEVIPKKHGTAFYARVVEVCDLAATHKIESFPDVTSLALAICLTDGALMTDPRLEQLLQQPDAHGRLGELLAELLPEDGVVI